MVTMSCMTLESHLVLEIMLIWPGTLLTMVLKRHRLGNTLMILILLIHQLLMEGKGIGVNFVETTKRIMQHELVIICWETSSKAVSYTHLTLPTNREV